MTLPFNCPFCAHDNPRGARFCNECGSPLHLAPCAHCDAVNDVELPACHSCGVPLPRVPHDDATIGASADAASLFADEPSHSISSDVDLDALDAVPRRDGRRTALPVALIALVLLIASAAVVGYVALRQGGLPGTSAAVAPAVAPAQSVAAVREEAAKEPVSADAGAQAPAPVIRPSTTADTSAAGAVDTPDATSPDTPATSAAMPDAPVPPPATTGTDAASVAPANAAAPAEANPNAESSAVVDAVKPPPAAATQSPPRRAPATKVEPAVDKDAAATQSLIRRETGGFGPPKPLPPRAPPDAH